MDSKQVVLFQLGKNTFAAPVTSVQEIIKTPEITVLPNTPSFFKGVINLRNKVIPVLGLCEKFEFGDNRLKNSRTVVVNVNDKTFGIIVDSVSEVLKLRDDSIEPYPDILGCTSQVVAGIAKLDQRLIILLNLEQLLSPDEILNLDSISEQISKNKTYIL